MKYPSFSEYQAALQHPGSVLLPKLFRNAKVQTDLWGLPRVRSGGFALAYQVSTDRGKVAIRCFHSNIPERANRYIKIQKEIENNHFDFLKPIRYVHAGIEIKKKKYPITIMEWIEGQTLEEFIYERLANPIELKQVCSQFVEIINHLESKCIAHGDLSQQNILIEDGKVYLIDYDGMFFPSMAGSPALENGHRDFQHPERTKSVFDYTIDRFSAIVLYLAMTALSIKPSLWQDYQGKSEGLLFSYIDFQSPYHSALLQELETFHDLREKVSLFRRICLTSIKNIPSLVDFLERRDLQLPRRENIISTQARTGEKISEIAAKEKFQILSCIGETIRVTGKVESIFRGTTQDGHPHTFINFGNWKEKCFTVVLEQDAEEHLVKQNYLPENLVGHHFTVTGMVTAYRRRPQIVVSSAATIARQILFNPDMLKSTHEEDNTTPESEIVIDGRLITDRKNSLDLSKATSLRVDELFEKRGNNQ